LEIAFVGPRCAFLLVRFVLTPFLFLFCFSFTCAAPALAVAADDDDYLEARLMVAAGWLAPVPTFFDR